MYTAGSLSVVDMKTWMIRMLPSCKESTPSKSKLFEALSVHSRGHVVVKETVQKGGDGDKCKTAATARWTAGRDRDEGLMEDSDRLQTDRGYISDRIGVELEDSQQQQDCNTTRHNTVLLTTSTPNIPPADFARSTTRWQQVSSV